MFLKDNFSEVHLLFSEPIECNLYKDEKANILLSNFKINLPTVKDLYFNSNVMFVLSILKQTIEDLNNYLKINIKFTSHLHFIQTLIVFKMKEQSIASIIHKIIQGLSYLCPEIHLENDTLKIKDRIIDDQIFERMRDIWLISIDARPFSNVYQYMSPEQRALEEKIQSIKNKGKNNKEDSFEKIYMILTYEFNYSRKDILNMTMYAVKTILKYTSKSINYKLTLIAKAFGNTKKIKFITDKGE